ncbi:hypothetical protein POM88_044263 [Heracleum sosnowskyi]|uniref:Ubiquitin-like protease family profile domain-containing protein n=1 Tax=Heracleum sosnowskyi TaxID=360622 RepID=A0AAD8H509_9APIA|nr:hypothetical protein POM88_044263 [Heracleum sosnowskyi]
MCRPISGPIHIDLEGEGDQNESNAENVVIGAAKQNEENQDIVEPDTGIQAVNDVIIGNQNQNNMTVREDVTLNDSSDDFVNPAPFSKPKGSVKRKLVIEDKNEENQEDITLNDSDDDFVNPTPWSKRKGKSNENDKAEKRRGKQKMEERSEIAEKEDEIAKSRNSPRILSDMICALSEEQQQWVRDVGFGNLLVFELVEMPQRLAYKIIEAFDERTCSLTMKKGDIEITEQAVHDVLGLPCCGAEIKFAKNSMTSERIIQWRSQFPVTNESQSLVKASEVVDMIKQTGEVDEIFKMNFLVVMTNVLIRSNTNNFVTQAILSMDDKLDNCSNYNWASYLIKSLVITKQRWKHTASLFYTGPMIFLLILYVDRVCFQGKQLVHRRFPAFIGWTKEKLKERELLEAEKDAFGSGDILQAVTVEELEGNEKLVWKEKEDAQEENGGAEIGNRDLEEDNEPQDWWNTLNIKAVFLIDANIQLIEAKDEYEAELANAKELHPNDEKIFEIEKRIKDLFKANKWMDSESYEDSFHDNENINIFPSQEEEVVVNTVVDVVEETELPPDHDDYLNIVAWLKSPEGILEIENDFQNQFIPSFSLGISQVCNDVMEEHGRDEYNKEGDDNRTPLPPKEPENKTNRDIKVGPAFRSPYIERNIDINSSYSRQEIAVYRWLIQEGMKDTDHIFVYGLHTFMRTEVRTLMPKRKLSYAVIDMWSILMNDRENYKSTEAPMRLYMDIGFSLAPLDEKNTKEKQYELFKNEMNHFFQRYSSRKLENVELIFFPVLAYGHMYMISFNLKKPAFDVIDNIRRGRNAGKEYGPKPKLLRQHFVKYLLENKLDSLASSLKKASPYYMVMPWQTLSNYKDCGIFLMRHLETYKGEPKSWITDLKVESVNILKEAKVLYNKMASEKAISIVLATSEGKNVDVRRKKDIKGKVLFPDDDTPEDDN